MEQSISLIHPSRSRSKMALDTVMEWASKASNPESIQYILSIDNDEPYLDGYQKVIDAADDLFEDAFYVKDNNKNVVMAANVAAKEAECGIIVLMSDDFSCPEKWDEFILENINPEKEEALQVNDGAWPEHRNIMTLPIITKKLYKKLGYIYNPIYEGYCADTDLGETCNAMGILKKNYTKPFIHKHWRMGTRERDSTDGRHDTPEKAIIGEQIFNERKKNNFGV